MNLQTFKQASIKNKKYNLLNLVKNKKVTFAYYRDKELWYKIDKSFLFPVPIDDIGNATFLAKDKAILFMRYIRKYLTVLAKEEIDESNS